MLKKNIRREKKREADKKDIQEKERIKRIEKEKLNDKKLKELLNEVAENKEEHVLRKENEKR